MRTAALVFVAWASSLVAAQDSTARGTWVTAWGTSQQALGDTQITNATVRLIARVAIPGDNVGIRLDNTFGQTPVTIGRAYVGYRIQGAAIAAGSNHSVTFDGGAMATIPGGGSFCGDP